MPKLQAQSPLTGIALSILFFRYTRSYRTLAKYAAFSRARALSLPPLFGSGFLFLHA